MKRGTAVLAAVALAAVLCGCGGKTRFDKSFYGFFDTSVTVVGYEQSAENFAAACELIEQKLDVYNKLFGIYNDYDGVVNAKTLNDRAGEFVAADAELVELLDASEKAYDFTAGRTNIALGAVLSLWHECRTNALKDPKNAAIPDDRALSEATKHVDINSLEIDKEKNAVRIADGGMSVDLGAVAKGFAAKKIAEALKSAGYDGFALNFGGAVTAIGARGDGKAWRVGIEDPRDTEKIKVTVETADRSLVTSGCYQRYFTVGGKNYNHIIDPQTLYPAEKCLSVSVIAEDPFIADALSTALFCLSPEQGRRLLEDFPDVCCMWILPDGSEKFAGGFEKYIVK